MSNSRILFAAMTLGMLAATPAVANDNFWLGVKGGTLGVGMEATWRPIPFFDLRAGGNTFTYDTDDSYSGVEYDVDLDMQTFFATANLRMPTSPFRLSAGLYSNGNKLALASRDSATYEIGDMTYTAGEVGSLTGSIGFDSTAPYLGVGADFRIANRFGLNLDLGVLWQGSARVGVGVTGPIASDPTFMMDLETERLQLEEDLDDFKAYPVASLGFSWNF